MNKHYTKEQIKYLSACVNGLVWHWFENPAADEVLRFLMDEKLIEGREDIARDLLKTTQNGLCVLEKADNNSDKQEREQDADRNEKTAELVEAKKNVGKEFAKNFCATVISFVIEHFGQLVALAQKVISSFRG